MMIRVETQQLLTAADEVMERVKNVSAGFASIEQIVRSSDGYWMGEGQEAYEQSYLKRRARIEQILDDFRENVTDLRKIAGVYTSAEAGNLDAENPLPSDVIV